MLTGDEPMSDTDREQYEIWWECRHAWAVFIACSTQWRSSLDGVTGIDLNPVLGVIDAYIEAHGIKSKERWQMINDIKSIETGVLKAFKETSHV